MECRGEGSVKICRTNICLEPGESCPQGNPGKPCCSTNGATCQGGACCQPLGSQCEQIPRTGEPCCGSNTECCGNSDQYCGPGRRETCCYQDFQNVFSSENEPRCTSNDQCCSGYCHTAFRNICCRPENAPCDSLGPLNFDCCPYLGLTCNGSTCVPCRKVGQSCTGSGSSSTCCIGATCDGPDPNNRVCTRDTCGQGGSPCQESSVCCPGFFCTAGGVCLFSCVAEGNGGCIAFGCCPGLTCVEDSPGGTCRRV
jgi:hypothetical protein